MVLSNCFLVSTIIPSLLDLGSIANDELDYGAPAMDQDYGANMDADSSAISSLGDYYQGEALPNFAAINDSMSADLFALPHSVSQQILFSLPVQALAEATVSPTINRAIPPPLAVDREGAIPAREAVQPVLDQARPQLGTFMFLSNKVIHLGIYRCRHSRRIGAAFTNTSR